ncbi:MAG: pyruvate/2-oxoglutarate dehydrogenase complex dihydrolipoamide acyltransferase (E2) component [Verrucomicrobiales bacterium]|jgi:pyruvate/2-oxoglutarate dehydrogenase complex dihydrolipoamide acyltransferase (E2) component
MPEIPIVMPQLGESIAEAVILSIDIAPGDQVDTDQEIIEVETNKAVMSVTTPCAGRVTKITAKTDVSYPVGATLGFLDVTEEEAMSSGVSLTPPQETGHFGATLDDLLDAGVAIPVSEAEADAAPAQNSDVPTSRVEPTVKGLPVPAHATGASYISPRMRARMDELRLNAADLAGIAGTGAAGRVTVEDFEAFLVKLETQKMTPASPMRIAVADSMRRSWVRPLATVGTPVRLDAVLNHRKTQTAKAGPALYTVRALALAIAENTAVAGRLVGERIVHPKAIDVGFAVEVADGVLVPVIHDVDSKSLAVLVPIYDDLITLARERRLPKEASTPGLATVTNFGSFGIDWATPIPLPEQNLVLGLGAGRKVPSWDPISETFVPVIEAQLTLSFDHRVLDGGAAGRLLAKISKLLQNPETL